MAAIDRGARQIALVVDDDGRLVGVLTDGDVRRALLRGVHLDAPLAPVVSRRFVAVAEADDRAAVIELMRARRIDAIPVLAPDGRPVGLHLLHEYLEPVSRPNWAVLMAGGQGMRLRPLTEAVPKPMLKVAGRPILERLVLHLVGFGIKRIFISINYLGDVIEQHFEDGSRFGCRIEYLRETAPLGTAGALGLLPAPPGDPVVVMNGDLVTTIDIAALLDVHASRRNAATVGIYRYLHTVPFGCVDRDGDRIVGIEEKPTISREVNSGVYVLDPSAVALVDGRTPETMPDLIARLLRRGDPVGAWDVDEDWIDVGHRDELARAREGA
jgi:dTDP-glucose pyrophosphorylase